MAFQAVPDTAMVQQRIEGTPAGVLDGLKWYLTFYVRDEAIGAWSTAFLTQLATYMSLWWFSGKSGGVGARTLVNGAWTLQETKATDLRTAGGVSVILDEGSPGTRSGDAVPPSAPLIVQMFGDSGGLPLRGRSFWSGGTEGDLSGDNYSDTYRNAVAQVFTDFRNGLGVVAQGGNLTWAQVLVSRNSGTVPDPSPPKVAVRRDTAVTNTLGAAASGRSIVGALRERRQS